MAVALGGPAPAAEKAKKAQAPYALLTGTVFRESGMAFAGAGITITAAGDSKEARKFRKMELVTSPRGEFVARLPAMPMNYKVVAKGAGYQPEEKAVAVTAEDRIDVYFRLEPASR